MGSTQEGECVCACACVCIHTYSRNVFGDLAKGRLVKKILHLQQSLAPDKPLRLLANAKPKLFKLSKYSWNRNAGVANLHSDDVRREMVVGMLEGKTGNE